MITISEGLGWLKTLQARHTELIHLRDQNAQVRVVRYGNDKPEEIKPVYDAKKLDTRITLLARETRLLTEAIKRTNAKTSVDGFERNDDVLGELEAV